MASNAFRTLKNQFSIDPDAGTERSSTPIQKLRRYLSLNEFPGYQSEHCLKSSDIVDDGHRLGLGNPTIIRNILKHLPPSDLIQARKVSLRWNHISCEYLRRSLGPCRIRPSRLKLFLKLMKRCFCNPFGSYAIRIEALNCLHIRSFFRRFSLDITTLRVKIASSEIPGFAKLLNSLTNLEALHLLRIPEGPLLSSRTEYQSSSAWKYGLFHFPSLKSIIFENDDPSTLFTRNYDNVLFDLINSAPNLLQVEFISWDSHLSRLFLRCGITNPKSFDGFKFNAINNPLLKDDLIELFFRRKMKFKALKFLISDKIPFDFVLELILQTAGRLYHLQLRNLREEEVFKVDLKLHRLITLGLQGWAGPVDFTQLTTNFPNLRTLKIVPSNFNFSQEENEVCMEHLKTLTIMPSSPLIRAPVGVELMERIVKMFPSVEELNLQVTGNKTLHVVYEGYCRGLKLLCVDLMGDVEDLGITGIEKDGIKIEGVWECGCSKTKVDDKPRKSKGIGNLNELRTLILRTGSLTDISFIEGIANLKNLEMLWLLSPIKIVGAQKNDDGQETLEPKASHRPWCLKAIADALPNLRHLITATDMYYSEEDLNYLHERLPNLEHEIRD